MIIESFKRKRSRLRRNCLRMSAGIITPFEFFLGVIGEVIGLVFGGIRQKLINSALTKRRKKTYLSQNCYLLKEAKIPLLEPHDEALFLSEVLEDTFYPYLYLEDNYDVNDVTSLEKLMPEGFYIYCDRTHGIDLRLRPDDIVIDAGAWIGDFSAYASTCGARSYAFEPLPKTFEILRKTSRLNKNIIAVNMGLGVQKEELAMFADERKTGSASISTRRRSSQVSVRITALDDFVEENKLERVDFIKADIEGHERFMLRGAKNVLKNFAPRLSICTYHLSDDPQVLENIIKEMNPAYEVIQGRKKLFAYIPYQFPG
jgi:FkbM family methyltransferase